MRGPPPPAVDSRKHISRQNTFSLHDLGHHVFFSSSGESVDERLTKLKKQIRTKRAKISALPYPCRILQTGGSLGKIEEEYEGESDDDTNTAAARYVFMLPLNSSLVSTNLFNSAKGIRTIRQVMTGMSSILP